MLSGRGCWALQARWCLSSCWAPRRCPVLCRYDGNGASLVSNAACDWLMKVKMDMR